MSERDVTPLRLRALFARESGPLYVQVHAESGREHRTFVLTADRVRRLRWLVSPFGVSTALLVVASWVFFAVMAARLPSAQRRIGELEFEAQRLDTLEARLFDLQVRYDKVTRMLGASSTDTTLVSPPGTSR